MKLKNGMTVISPVDAKIYGIKKGDEFIVNNVNKSNHINEFNFEIKSNGLRYCLLKGCGFINGKNWIIKNENPT